MCSTRSIGVSSHLDVGLCSVYFIETKSGVERNCFEVESQNLEVDGQLKPAGFFNDDLHAGRPDPFALVVGQDEQLMQPQAIGVALNGQNADVDP